MEFTPFPASCAVFVVFVFLVVVFVLYGLLTQASS
jgi:hypothetical protein